MNKEGILLKSYGQFEKEFLEKIANQIKIVFELPVETVDEKIDISDFFDPSRRQYDANNLLKHITANTSKRNLKTVGLFHVDLFIPILTFIFGQAIFKGDAGIASIYRLKNELYGMPRNEKLLFDRFQKVVVHELGHTFGLIHCHVPNCVMRSSTYVEDIDQKEHNFCKKCRDELETALNKVNSE